jgi:hypothetical protein
VALESVLLPPHALSRAAMQVRGSASRRVERYGMAISQDLAVGN